MFKLENVHLLHDSPGTPTWESTLLMCHLYMYHVLWGVVFLFMLLELGRNQQFSKVTLE